MQTINQKEKIDSLHSATVEGSAEVDFDSRVYYVNGQTLTSTEYLGPLYTELEKEYTLVGEVTDLMGTASYIYVDENQMREAYNKYHEKR